MAKVKHFSEQELVFKERPKSKRFKDLTGTRFGKLAILGFAGIKSGTSTWFCKCDCGTIKIIHSCSMRAGNTVSCGCHSRKSVKERSTTHGHTKNGKASRTFKCWEGLRRRCNNKNDKDFHKYGGRGIKVCKRWGKFENFLEDMGESPGTEYSIDRIDNNGNYEPSNCRWATVKQQANNRRTTRIINFDGKSLSITQWSEKTGIHKHTIFGRLRKGWPIEKALTTPAMIKRG